MGRSLALNAFAVFVIGGISLSGGKGDVLGSIFGSIFIGLIIHAVLSAKVFLFY